MGEPRAPEFQMPAECPVCGSEIVHEEGEVGLCLRQRQLSGADARVDPPFRLQELRSISMV